MRRFEFIGIILAIFFGCAACSQDAQQEAPKQVFSAIDIAAGQKLLPTYCNTCHGIKESESAMLAPPLWGVRQHYLARYPEPNEFVEAMLRMMEAPTHETSLMPLAVERYGLMAPVSLDRDTLRLTAIAIYSGAVERPSWVRDYLKSHQSCIDSLLSRHP